MCSEQLINNGCTIIAIMLSLCCMKLVAIDNGFLTVVDYLTARYRYAVTHLLIFKQNLRTHEAKCPTTLPQCNYHW